MPLLTIPSGNVASAIGGAYEVANSCRFNDGDSAYMRLTPGSSATSSRKMTVSFWCKRGNLGITGRVFSADTSGSNNNRDSLFFNSDDNLWLYIDNGQASNLKTTRVFRDPSAWYHIVLAIDTTQSTNTDRVKIYINGVQETSFQTGGDGIVYPDQNYDVLGYGQNGREATIGADTDNGNSDNEWDGYLAEFVFIDGLQLTPTSFGEFDEDSPTIWKPKDVSGLTFGTNGFYLDFEDSANLGNDANGGTDFTETNLAATDQSTDTCTLNYSTFNPLDNTYGQGTFSEGNLKIVTSSSLYCTNTSTFNLTKGKWHFEVKVGDSNGKNCIGIAGATTPHVSGDSTLAFGDSSNEYSYTASGELRHSGSSTGSWGSSFTNGDIIGCAFDLDNNELFFYKNGTIQNSGTAFSITDPTSTLSGGYFVGAGDFASDNTSTMEYNFGSPSYSISSGNTDANGYGNFEYPVKSGHYAINSANLAEFG
jgi:hypothetical protein